MNGAQFDAGSNIAGTGIPSQVIDMARWLVKTGVKCMVIENEGTVENGQISHTGWFLAGHLAEIFGEGHVRARESSYPQLVSNIFL
jgi:hypothetical protein